MQDMFCPIRQPLVLASPRDDWSQRAMTQILWVCLLFKRHNWFILQDKNLSWGRKILKVAEDRQPVYLMALVVFLHWVQLCPSCLLKSHHLQQLLSSTPKSLRCNDSFKQTVNAMKALEKINYCRKLLGAVLGQTQDHPSPHTFGVKRPEIREAVTVWLGTSNWCLLPPLTEMVSSSFPHTGPSTASPKPHPTPTCNQSPAEG